MEQLATHKLAMDQRKGENGHHQWFSMTEYKGLEWSNSDRTDGWPDYEYHQFQTIQSGINAETGTLDWEMTQVNRLVPQFWAYAQVLSKSWFLFTSGLHEHDDEWNQTVSKQIHDVCLMMKTADLLPVDYTEWYAFVKGWIDDFKKTRTKLLATRDVPAGVSPAGAAGQSDAVGLLSRVPHSRVRANPQWKRFPPGIALAQ